MPSIIPRCKMTDCFAQKLLEFFNFVPERESLNVTNDFISGELMEKLLTSGMTEDEAKRRYHHQCLRSLDWSFSDNVVRDPIWLTMFAGAIEEMEHHIQDAFALGVTDPDTMRDRIPLDSIPFKYPKRKQKDIHALPKDDEVRIAFQALFLFLLRPHVPLKYSSLEDFLQEYPSFNERSVVEQDRLRNTANWMILCFYTIQPRNNKTFILNLIPRIVEGRNARYITGSGQTRPTADRVDLFRLEGNCEKIKRPPRRKKEILLDGESNPTVKADGPVPKTKDQLSSSGSVVTEKSINSNGQSLNGNVAFTPMVIPYFQGFPNFSAPNSGGTLEDSYANDTVVGLNGKDDSQQTENPLILSFPGGLQTMQGIPIVMIPQLPLDEDGKNISNSSQFWNNSSSYSYGMSPTMPFSVSSRTVSGECLISAKSPSSQPSIGLVPSSYHGGYTFMLPQNSGQAQSAASISPLPTGSPIFFCPQVFMKPPNSVDVEAPSYIGVPVDYTTGSQKRTRLEDPPKASKKKKSSAKSMNGKDSVGLPRSISVGSNEGGLEMLIAAAGDLEVETV